MKKTSLIITAAALFLTFSCKSNKSANENQSTESDTTAVADTGNTGISKDGTTFDVSMDSITNDKGETIQTAFNTAEENVTILYNGDTLVLKQQPSASGIKYANDNYEYTEWQGDVELTQNGKVVFEYKNKAEEFVNNKGQKLTATYNTRGEKPTVKINFGKYKDEVLTQTTAWAKGAEYENKTMKWTTTKTGGKLQVDGKTITFKSGLK